MTASDGHALPSLRITADLVAEPAALDLLEHHTMREEALMGLQNRIEADDERFRRQYMGTFPEDPTNVDWRYVFDTRGPHAPQNYDEIEAVLDTLNTYMRRASTTPAPGPYPLREIARHIAGRLREMRRADDERR